MIPFGQDPAREFSRGFFELAKGQTPSSKRSPSLVLTPNLEKPQPMAPEPMPKRLALPSSTINSIPLLTTDLSPIARAIKATNPDVVFAASYPPDTVAFVRAANEAGLVPSIMGGTLIGMLATPLKILMVR